MAKIITENNFDNIILEKKNDNLYIKGVFSTYGVKNNNDRTYPKEVLESAVNKIEERMKMGSVYGELDHPEKPSINMKNAAIVIESLSWKDNNLIGKAKVLNTPSGQIAKTLMENGPLGISSRGLGSVSEDGTVKDDYHLITWDLVAEPSNSGSWVNGIYEGQEYNIQDIQESDLVDTNDIHVNSWVETWKKTLQNEYVEVDSERKELFKQHMMEIWSNRLKRYSDNFLNESNFPYDSLDSSFKRIEKEYKDCVASLIDFVHTPFYKELLKEFENFRALRDKLQSRQ